MVSYKVRRNYRRGPRNPFYINVADFHNPYPTLKNRPLRDVDGEIIPIIHVNER